MQQQSETVVRHSFNGMQIAAIEHEGDLWMTGEDVGQALEYSDPRDAIKKLFARNQTELERYSAVVKMVVQTPEKGDLRGQPVPAGGVSGDEIDPSGVTQRRAVRVFNEEGVMILTMLSSQPRAAEFRAWAVGILKAYRHGELALTQPQNRETLLVTCIKEARFGNPFAIHTLIERFGYPQSIKREVKADLYRRAFRDKAESPEIVDWFIDDFLPDLRTEIETAPGKYLNAIRNQPPGNWSWKEFEDPPAVWTLRHRAPDLYRFIVPLAEAEEIEIDLTSNRFTRWLTYGAARLKARGWERIEHKRSKGQETFLLRMLDIAE